MISNGGLFSAICQHTGQREQIREKHLGKIYDLFCVFFGKQVIFMSRFVADGSYFMRPLRKAVCDDMFRVKVLNLGFQVFPCGIVQVYSHLKSLSRHKPSRAIVGIAFAAKVAKGCLVVTGYEIGRMFRRFCSRRLWVHIEKARNREITFNHERIWKAFATNTFIAATTFPETQRDIPVTFIPMTKKECHIFCQTMRTHWE